MPESDGEAPSSPHPATHNASTTKPKRDIASRIPGNSPPAHAGRRRQVELARARLGKYGDRVRLWAGDAERIDAPDGAYDAVFDFGIVHHIPSWRAALSEITRVLAPGGRFFAEEVMRSFIHNPVWRRLLDHPMEDRFGWFVAQRD